MDILTHTLSGVAVGTTLVAFFKKRWSHNLGIIALSALGGAFPDVDAVSLWSGFDGTFGKLFSLNHSGKEIYSAHFWYSHHTFFHSLLASILLPLLVVMFIGMLKSFRKSNVPNPFKNVIVTNKLLLLGFIISYNVHLFEDMPTPSGSWGGVAYLWPFNLYIGGTGQIWWWNNYDIFLIVISTIAVNSLILIFRKRSTFNVGLLSLFVLLAGTLFILIQINARNINFNKSKFSLNEKQSLIIQNKFLGSKTYGIMNALDNSLKINF